MTCKNSLYAVYLQSIRKMKKVGKGGLNDKTGGAVNAERARNKTRNKREINTKEKEHDKEGAMMQRKRTRSFVGTMLFMIAMVVVNGAWAGASAKLPIENRGEYSSDAGMGRANCRG